MSRHLKGQIFFMHPSCQEDVEFYRVTRSTTNTCEVSKLGKSVVYQNENTQYVEPDLQDSGGVSRCKVVSQNQIKFKSGEIGTLWDGKPVKQNTIIFMYPF